jgi:hypothetical protein
MPQDNADGGGAEMQMPHNLTPSEARDIAAVEYMHQPYSLAWALNNDMGIDDPALQVDVDTLCRPELLADEATNAQLLAVLMNSMCSTTVYAAARELSQRVEAAMQPAIKARAAELLRAQDRALKLAEEEALS